MPNETLESIMGVPLFWRAAISLFVIWFIYMLASRLIFKLIAFAIAFVNFLWYLLYLAVNNLMHTLHKVCGKSMSDADQSATDFFGVVYGFNEKIKEAIENSCRVRGIDNEGKRQFDEDGKPKYTNNPKKPFAGTAFLIAMILVFWISAPTWLNNEDKTNAFTGAYHRYIEFEGKVLDMIFADK